MSNYNYETEEYRGYNILIDYDYDCESPRDYDGNLSHMICFHSRYNLGDEHDYNDAKDFLKSLAREYVSNEELKTFLLKHEGDCWIEKTEFGYTLHDGENGYYDEDYSDEEADADSISADAWVNLSEQDLYSLLENSKELVISTIGYYEHSGITVYIGGRCDAWDSGICGFIFQTKEDTLKNIHSANESNWEEKTWENMKQEMKVYDAYVTGECFGWQVQTKDGELVESCWGYVGHDTIKEMKEESKAVVDNILAA